MRHSRRCDQAYKLRALLVEDDRSDVDLVLHSLKNGGFEAQADVVQSEEDFTERIRKNSYDVVLADYNLPGWNGMETVDILRREGVDIPVLVVSGALGDVNAVGASSRGRPITSSKIT